MKHPVIFWDVDTQHDFMDPDGKLYVKDAELIKPKLEQLTRYAHAQGIQIVASSDDHELEHAEISATPNFRETFPPHCMRGTTGAEKIPETRLDSPLIVELDPIPHETLVRRLAAHESDVLLHVYRDETRFRDPVSTAMVSKLQVLDVKAPIESLLPVFEVGHVAIVMDGEKFLGLITRIDLLNYLRRRAG